MSGMECPNCMNLLYVIDTKKDHECKFCGDVIPACEIQSWIEYTNEERFDGDPAAIATGAMMAMEDDN